MSTSDQGIDAKTLSASELKKNEQRINRLQEELARARAAQEKSLKKIDDRRKVLVGAFVLDQLQSIESAAAFKVGSKSLDEWLTRPTERALFGLAPLPKGNDQ